MRRPYRTKPFKLDAGAIRSDPTRTSGRPIITPWLTISTRQDKSGRWHAWCEEIPSFRASSVLGSSGMCSREAVRDMIIALLNPHMNCAIENYIKENGGDLAFMWPKGIKLSKSNRHKQLTGKEYHWPDGTVGDFSKGSLCS